MLMEEVKARATRQIGNEWIQFMRMDAYCVR